MHEQKVFRSPNFHYTWPLGEHLLSIVPQEEFRQPTGLMSELKDTIASRVDCSFELRINGLPFRVFERQRLAPQRRVEETRAQQSAHQTWDGDPALTGTSGPYLVNSSPAYNAAPSRNAAAKSQRPLVPSWGGTAEEYNSLRSAHSAESSSGDDATSGLSAPSPNLPAAAAAPLAHPGGPKWLIDETLSAAPPPFFCSNGLTASASAAAVSNNDKTLAVSDNLGDAVRPDPFSHFHGSGVRAAAVSSTVAVAAPRYVAVPAATELGDFGSFGGFSGFDEFGAFEGCGGNVGTGSADPWKALGIDATSLPVAAATGPADPWVSAQCLGPAAASGSPAAPPVSDQCCAAASSRRLPAAQYGRRRPLPTQAIPWEPVASIEPGSEQESCSSTLPGTSCRAAKNRKSPLLDLLGLPSASPVKAKETPTTANNVDRESSDPWVRHQISPSPAGSSLPRMGDGGSEMPGSWTFQQALQASPCSPLPSKQQDQAFVDPWTVSKKAVNSDGGFMDTWPSTASPTPALQPVAGQHFDSQPRWQASAPSTTSTGARRALLQQLGVNPQASSGSNGSPASTPSQAQQLSQERIGPPVQVDLAQEFLKALHAEYVMGEGQAVGDLYDRRDVPQRVTSLLDPFEEQVRAAPNAAAAIAGLAVQWAIPSPAASAPSASPGVAERPIRPGRRRALLVGVNYFGTRAELRGCINDVHNMHALLVQTLGWDPTCIRTLTDDSPGALPTRANIEGALRWLVQDAKPGDSHFFHFSGHGAQQEDPNGYEEDGMNETILPMDFQRAGMMTDDHISDLTVKSLPEGARLTVVMDSCHSGTGLDLPFKHTAHGWQEETNPYHSPGDVQLFSGCEDQGTSTDASAASVQAGGAMTTAFCDVLRADPCPAYAALMVHLHTLMRSRGFSQRPQLTSSQAFSLDRPFHLDDAIPNSNLHLGRTVRKMFQPRPRLISGPLREALQMGAAVIGGMAVGGFALEAASALGGLLF